MLVLKHRKLDVFQVLIIVRISWKFSNKWFKGEKKGQSKGKSLV